MADFRLSVSAGRDLTAIRDYIFDDNPSRAISFVDEIIALFEVIAQRPSSFPEMQDGPVGVRSALHGRYRILFEIVEGVPHILRVVHGARDIPILLDGD